MVLHGKKNSKKKKKELKTKNDLLRRYGSGNSPQTQSWGTKGVDDGKDL